MFILLFIAIGTISAVNATVINTTDTVAVEDIMTVENDEIISSEDNGEILSANIDGEILGNTYSPANFNELKNAVAAASDGDTIYLSGTYTFTSTISASKSLNFVGTNNAVCDGSSSVQLFDGFSAGVCTFSFKDITFKNGKGLYNAGAISAMCNVDHCTFINNVGIQGGAINGAGTIKDSTFQGNKALNGGAIYTGSTFTITGCTFKNNKARDGGAIYELYETSISGCTFESNTATNFDSSLPGNFGSGLGGAIYYNGGSVKNSNFYSNSDDSGLNVYISCDDLDFSGCTFTSGAPSNAILRVSGVTLTQDQTVTLKAEKLNAKGPLSGNEIKFSVGDSTYTKNTDSNGVVEINPNWDLPIVKGVNPVLVSSGGIKKTVNVIKYLYSYLEIDCDEGKLTVKLDDLEGPLANQMITFSVNGNSYVKYTNSTGFATFNVKDYYTDLMEYTVGVNFKDTGYNKAVSENVKTQITKYDSKLDVENLHIVKGDNGIINVSLHNVNGNLVGESVVFTVNGEKIYKPTNDKGQTTLSIKDYFDDVGEYTVNVAYEGNSLNNGNSTDITIFIYSYEGNLAVNQIGTYYNDTILSFRLIDSRTLKGVPDANISIAFSNNETLILTTDANGVANYSVQFVPNTYSLSARIVDLNVDVNTIESQEFIIKNIVGVIELSQDGVTYNNSNLVVRLYNAENNDVYRKIKVILDFNSIGKREYVTTDDEGIAVYPIPFDVGTYDVLASVSSDYASFENAQKDDIIIDKSDSTVSGNPIVFDYGSSGSTTLTPTGCSITLSGLSVVDHSEANIALNGNKVTVSGLGIGTYKLMIVTTPDSNHKSITETIDITVNKVASNVVFSPISFDYGTSGSTSLILTGASVNLDNIKVIGHDEAVISLNNNNVVTVSNLAAGTYTLQVTTVPDDNHVSVTKTGEITVNKIDSDVTANNIIFDYNSSGSTTLTPTGCSITLSGLSVVDHSEANIALNNNKVTVSNLNAGTYTLQVTTTPDANHKSVTRNIGITVNKIDSDVTANNIIFDYNSSGSTTLTPTGCSITLSGLSVVDHSEANIALNNNKVTVSNLNAGTYTLMIVTTPDSNHKSVTRTIGITVNKINSDVTFTNTIAFNAGSSGSTTISVTGGTTDLSYMRIVDHNEAVIRYDNGVVSVSGLDVGTYTLSVTVNPDSNHKTVTKSVGISVTGAGSSTSGKTESKVSFSTTNLIFDYGSSGYTTLALVGCTVSPDNVFVNGYPGTAKLEGTKITISGLNPGSYTLYVVTTPYENYYSVTSTLEITVNKVSSAISFDSDKVTFDYGSSGSVRVTVDGGTLTESGISILNHKEAKITLDGDKINVSGLDAGSYTLSVTSLPDNNHAAITRTIGLTVNKVDSSIMFNNEQITFVYGGSGSIGVNVNGGSISMTGVSVVGYDVAPTFKDNKISVSGLNVGEYTLKVTTTPDSNHNAVTDTSIKIIVTKAKSKIGNTGNIIFDYGSSGSTSLILEGCSANINDIKVAGYNVPISIDNNNVVTVSGLNAGSYNLTVTSTPDSNHESVTETIGITVNKIKSEVSFNGKQMSFVYGGSSSIGVNINGGTLTENGISVLNHKDAEINLNSNIVTVSGLDVGTYTLSVTSSPDKNHVAITNTVDIVVTKASSSVKFDNDLIFDYGSSGSLSVTVNGGTLTESGISVLNHKEAKITLNNNIITVSNLNAGSYTLSITTLGDSNHNSVTNTLGFTVNRINSTIAFDSNKITFVYGSSGSIGVTVDGGSISMNDVSVVGSDVVPTIKDNKITISGLDVGNYTLKVTTTPDSNHLSNFDESIGIVVSKAKSNIEYVNDIVFDYLGSGSTTLILTGCIVNVKDMTVVGYEDTQISIDRNNIVSVSGLDDGNYTLKVISTPDSNHETNEAYIPITVNKADSDVAFTEKNGILFKYGQSGSTVLILTGCSDLESYYVEDHDGAEVTFKDNLITVSGLDVGNYKLHVKTDPDRHYNSIEKTISISVVKNPAKIIVKKQTFAYKKSGKWEISLKDSDGDPISRMKVTLKIYTGKKYKTYTVTTNAKGVAYFKTSALALGTHKVVLSASHAGYTFKTVTSSVKIIKQTALKFKATKKNLVYGASLSITVTNKQTKKLLNGIKVKLLIYTGSKLTKTVILKTTTKFGYKGICGYNTNELSVGTHTVKIVPYDNVKYGGSVKSSLTITKAHKKKAAQTNKVSAKV